MPKDVIQAYKWFTLAARAGHERAAKGQTEVGLEMTAPQLREAVRLVAEFKPNLIRPVEFFEYDSL